MSLQQSIASVTEHVPGYYTATDQQTTFTKTRRFVLTWDNSRIPPSNRRVGYNYKEQQRCDGVCFGNGLVALDIGKGYETMGEMETLLALNGTYSITWLD